LIADEGYCDRGRRWTGLLERCYDRDFLAMKPESIAFALAGIAFGLIAGWVIGAEQTAARRPAAAVQAPEAAPPAAPDTASRAAVLDQAQVTALTAIAEREPSSVKPRVELANLYFDAERYADAIKWYTDALRLGPNDVNVSTDLGVSYYYTNQPDKALQQFDHSLALDPKHAKTLLNVGIVRAFGKQDLEGALKVWQQVVQIAPASPEGQAAKRAIDSVRAAHPDAGTAAPNPGT
jgi:tetratricopeptide (TPR) repeat protein